MISLYNCDVNAICIDLEQGYTCSCKFGYVEDGQTFTDKSREYNIKLYQQMVAIWFILLFLHHCHKLKSSPENSFEAKSNQLLEPEVSRPYNSTVLTQDTK